MIRRVSTFAFACAVALACPASRAAGDDDAKAKVLFDEARDLAKANKWAEACEKLEQSNRLAPRMLTTYRLADCHERIGKTASAHAGYVAAADLAKASGDATKQQDALNHAKSLEAKLSRVSLSLPEQPGLSVKIDGEQLEPELLHEKLPLDPGEHTLVASASGKLPRTVTFEVPKGPSVTTVEVAPLEAKKDSPKPPEEPVSQPPPVDDTKPAETKSSSSLRTIGFVALGVGAVGLGVGAALGLSAKSLDGDAEALCKPRCTPEGKQLNDDARARGDLATVVVTAGAVIATTGVVLVLVAPSSTAPTSARVAPWVGAGGFGLNLAGSF